MSSLAQRLLVGLSRRPPSAAAVVVEKWKRAILEENKAADVLVELNALKKASFSDRTTPLTGVDYARAVCFLKGEGNLFEVRQALLEEVRHSPQHEEAQELLARVQSQVRPLLLPPVAFCARTGTLSGAHVLPPMFSLLCDALLDYTMLSWKRLFNLYGAVEELYGPEWHGAPPRRAPVVECGTAAGGSGVLLAVAVDHVERRLAQQFPHLRNAPRRQVYCLDTFTGMPSPTSEDVLVKSSFLKSVPLGEEQHMMRTDDKHVITASVEEDLQHAVVIEADNTSWGTGTCAASQTSVETLANHFGVRDRMVVLPGLFQETIPTLFHSHLGRASEIGLLHVDADWYGSTKYVLETLLPCMAESADESMSVPGAVQVDDYYYWKGCKQAVDEVVSVYRTKEKKKRLVFDSVDNNAVFFQWK